MATQGKTPVKAASTTFEIVEALLVLEGAKVTELAEHMDLPKSTVHNYLATLEQEQYLVNRGGEYYPSLRFLPFGERARNRHNVYETAKPELKELASSTGELINLQVEEHGRGVYIYRTKGNRSAALHTYVGGHVGERAHLHSCAPGKAILANMEPSRLDEIIDRYGLPQATEQTIQDQDELKAELQDIRERGTAFDIEEHYSGLCSVAAAICRDNTVYGAISISGPKSQMTEDRMENELAPRITDVANVIEINMTFL